MWLYIGLQLPSETLRHGWERTVRDADALETLCTSIESHD